MFPDSPSSFCPCSSLLLFLASSCHCLSVQFSCSVVSESLRPHGLQHARLPCPLPTPRSCSNSCPSLVMPSNHLILSCLLLLLSSVFPSIRVFSNESALQVRWPNYWSFSFSTSPFNDYSGLLSLRVYWFDLLAVRCLYYLLSHWSSSCCSLASASALLLEVLKGQW